MISRRVVFADYTMPSERIKIYAEEHCGKVLDAAVAGSPGHDNETLIEFDELTDAFEFDAFMQRYWKWPPPQEGVHA